MIRGKLVDLRAMSVADVDRLVAWVNDREVTRYLTRRYPTSRESEAAMLQRETASPLSYDSPFFSIDTHDGEHIGTVGFVETSAEDRRGRLGITIGDKRYWSKGYGTDAIQTLLRFAFGEMNLHRVDLATAADNARAIACYRKCGFRDEVRMRQVDYREGRYGDGLVMGILRQEWEARR